MIDRFLKYLSAEKQYSRMTERAYRDDLCHFCLYLGLENPSLFDSNMVDHKVVRGWVMEMTAQKCAPSTINRRISTLKSFYRFLLREEIVLIDPTQKITSQKKATRVPTFIEKTKANKILDDTLALTNDFVLERDSLIILMFYCTGMRLAELIATTLQQINLEEREVKIVGKGNKERLSPLPLIILPKIAHYLELRKSVALCPSLFVSTSGKTISRTTVYNIVHRSLKTLGVDGKCSPHVLRHTFATHLLGCGVGIESVRELLGHSNLSTTQIYTHNSIEQLKESYNLFHPHSKK